VTEWSGSNTEIYSIILYSLSVSSWCCSNTRSAGADCSWTSQERKRLCYQHGCGWRIFVSGKYDKL